MSTNRFTMDNTEGYTQEQLDRLNQRFEERATSLREANVVPGLAEAPAWWMKSELDRIAEQVQAEFDSEVAA